MLTEHRLLYGTAFSLDLSSPLPAPLLCFKNLKFDCPDKRSSSFDPSPVKKFFSDIYRSMGGVCEVPVAMDLGGFRTCCLLLK